MATRYTDEFRRDAVRIAINSGLTRPEVLSDLGVGLSKLDKWVQQQHDDLLSGPHEDVEKENSRPKAAFTIRIADRNIVKRISTSPVKARLLGIHEWGKVIAMTIPWLRHSSNQSRLS